MAKQLNVDHVLEGSVRKAGSRSPMALEVGSKPELLGVLAIHDNPEALLICNGYKDREYIELALMASKLGRRPIVVIEQLDELDLVLAALLAALVFLLLKRIRRHRQAHSHRNY